MMLIILLHAFEYFNFLENNFIFTIYILFVKSVWLVYNNLTSNKSDFIFLWHNIKFFKHFYVANHPQKIYNKQKNNEQQNFNIINQTQIIHLDWSTFNLHEKYEDENKIYVLAIKYPCSMIIIICCAYNLRNNHSYVVWINLFNMSIYLLNCLLAMIWNKWK